MMDEEKCHLEGNPWDIDNITYENCTYQLKICRYCEYKICQRHFATGKSCDRCYTIRRLWVSVEYKTFYEQLYDTNKTKAYKH